MLHPFENSLSDLSDSELENKLQEITKKYFMAQRLGNHELLTQLSTFVTIYKDEMKTRYLKKSIQNDKDLDQLINVD